MTPLKYLSLSLCALSFLIAAPSASAQSPADRVAVECASCTQDQRINAAIAVTPAPGSADVYVMEPGATNPSRFLVSIDVEPGLYVASATPEPMESEVVASLNTIAIALAQEKTFRVDAGVSPAGCSAGGSSFAANMVSNSACSGAVESMLADRFSASRAAINESYARFFRDLLTQAERERSPGAAPEERIRVDIKGPDGSMVTVELVISPDETNTNPNFQGTLLIRMTILAASANGLRLPVSASDLHGRTYEGLSGPQTNDINALIERWRFRSRRECASQHRIQCFSTGECLSLVTCAPGTGG